MGNAVQTSGGSPNLYGDAAEVPLGSRAFFRGKDPVLAAALAYRPGS